MADGFTIREAAAELGVSVAWLRKQIRQGRLAPDKVRGKRGQEYRFTADDLEAASALRRVPATTGLARYQEQVAAMAAAVAEARARLDEQQQRAERAETALARERERVEALKALGVWDRLLGRHKGI